MRRKSGIQQAVEVMGSQSELARRLGVTHQAVNRWVKLRRIPYKWCSKIKKLTGIKLSILIPEFFNVKS